MYHPDILALAESRGWDREMHSFALADGDADLITLTHPSNWLTEDEVEQATKIDRTL